MAYSFKHVTIYVVDIHAAISLVNEPGKNFLQNDFAFLSSKMPYIQQFWSPGPVTTASFAFKGLSAKHLERSHFWKPLCDSKSIGGRPDVWALQIPFVGRYMKPGLQLIHGAKGVTVSVVPTIYLSAMGWSVHLKIDLEGDIKKGLLIDLVGWLSGGKNERFSFKTGQEQKTSKDVFRYFNHLVKEEVYRKEHEPHPGMKIYRQHVISINSYEGSVQAYSDMPSDEKALMRSILFGQVIDPLNLSKEEVRSPVTKTLISTSGVNFALSDFDRGTLIFLQREANNLKPINREFKHKVACFANNSKNCLMLSYLMWQFYTESSEPTVVSELGDLRDEVLFTLRSMPVNFRNLFCKNLFLQHNKIAGLVRK